MNILERLTNAHKKAYEKAEQIDAPSYRIKRAIVDQGKAIAAGLNAFANPED